jgi:hypothetical protein
MPQADVDVFVYPNSVIGPKDRDSYLLLHMSHHMLVKLID